MTEIVSAVYEMRNEPDKRATSSADAGNSEAVMKHAVSVFQVPILYHTLKKTEYSESLTFQLYAKSFVSRYSLCFLLHKLFALSIIRYNKTFF